VIIFELGEEINNWLLVFGECVVLQAIF